MDIILWYNQKLQKEFPIDLTSNEKRVFLRFISFYLGASFLLLVIIGLLYYQNDKKLYFDLAKTKIQNIAANISSKVILAHMGNDKLTVEDLLFEDEYKISFYTANKKKIKGDINEELDFSKKLIKNEKGFILIINDPYGHLGVSYIAVKNDTFYIKIKELKENTLMIFLFIYLIIALIGFYLARLFLQPIKDEREKLNNFIKDTTHELNTPISAILMSSETKDDNLSKKQVQRIQIAAHRISEIYKDLTYLFLEEKEEKKDLEEINLSKIALEQIKYFEAIAEKRKIIMNIDIQDLNFKIERNDFIRLFNNILSNAIKYNKKNGSIDIVIKQNQLIISDTGIGIEEQKQKDIFKRYFRATSTSGGFGIGLNIVREICQRYNIASNVYSKQNEGTTFTFNF